MENITEEQSIVEKVHEHALNRPNSLAAVFDNDEVTYAELWDSVLRCCSVLRHAGVQGGDYVVFQSCCTRYYLIVFYAAHLCHASFVPVDKNATSEVLQSLCQRMGVRCLISKEICSGVKNSFTYSELQKQLSLASTDVSYTYPSMEEAALVLFTTGTTGASKGAVISQRSLSVFSITEGGYAGYTANTVNLFFVPVNHAGPMWTIYATAYFGGATIMLDGILRLKLMYEYLAKFKVTALYMPPSAFAILAQSKNDSLAHYANQISFVLTGSSSINEFLRTYVTHLLPCSILFFAYGSSEMGLVSGLDLNASTAKPINCVGMPLPGVSVRIVDDDKNDVQSGQPGQIMVKSAMNFSGYWNNPELTEKVTWNGYVVSDDIGYLDEDGYLYIVGRKDDMINIGGLKVFPAEIENAAMLIDGVQDCICFRTQDPITGQGAKLLIQKRDNSTLTLQEIRVQLLRQLDSYKVPSVIEFTDHIEKTANGKPNRKAYQ